MRVTHLIAGTAVAAAAFAGAAQATMLGESASQAADTSAATVAAIASMRAGA
jgi:hypothetical protein